ncbi:hypothetical protein BpHYR1_038313 [Brachionus plicatilis]|uniref:Uncharacterized protein n=1 Tax=Brachionus plicatilis TaxID=10195 RepID=A0A3M7RYC1_BRAPC|nr:hypothetical protein BpHYR1_038313 [Brachionus plicatilis]
MDTLACAESNKRIRLRKPTKNNSKQSFIKKVKVIENEHNGLNVFQQLLFKMKSSRSILKIFLVMSSRIIVKHQIIII